jgi:hypothetical protein
MTKTVLQLVQDILVDINGDEVNSITDTVEAEQIANILKSSYEALVSSDTWPHTRRAIVLNAYSDSTKPNYMTLQDEVKELCAMNYNCIKAGETRKNYKPLTYLDTDKFLVKTNARDNTKSNVDVIIDPSGIELLIQNDKRPEYFTSFNDKDLIFDSYDSAVDSTLQESKFQAQGYIIPSFTVSDSFMPDIPPEAVSYLREETVSRVQLKLREFEDIKAEQSASTQKRTLSRKNWRVNGGTKYPNYGRKR